MEEEVKTPTEGGEPKAPERPPYYILGPQRHAEETSEPEEVAEPEVQEEPEPQTRKLSYRAEKREWEDELPSGLKVDSPEAEEWLRDKMAGYRSTLLRKSQRDDPNMITNAVVAGVREAITAGKQLTPEQTDELEVLMTPNQKQRYQQIQNGEVGIEETTHFFVDLLAKNQRVMLDTFKETTEIANQLKQERTLAAIRDDLATISAIDSNVPDPRKNFAASFEATLEYQDWLRENPTTAPVSKSYKWFLADTGKVIGQDTQKAKEQLESQRTSALTNIAKQVGKPTDGGSVIGRKPTEKEIRAFASQNGWGTAIKKYGTQASEVHDELYGLTPFKPRRR